MSTSIFSQTEHNLDKKYDARNKGTAFQPLVIDRVCLGCNMNKNKHSVVFQSLFKVRYVCLGRIAILTLVLLRDRYTTTQVVVQEAGEGLLHILILIIEQQNEE